MSTRREIWGEGCTCLQQKPIQSQGWVNFGEAAKTVAQHKTSIVSICGLILYAIIPHKFCRDLNVILTIFCLQQQQTLGWLLVSLYYNNTLFLISNPRMGQRLVLVW